MGKIKLITVEYIDGTIETHSFENETISEAGDNDGNGTIEIIPEDENSQIAPSPENDNPNQDENEEDVPDKDGDYEDEIED